MGCAKELTLDVWEPKEGATVTESQVEVRGYVSNYKAMVWVNDKIAAIKKQTRGTGIFSTTITLIEGENVIEVTAAQGKEGKWKNVVGKTVTITYTPK